MACFEDRPAERFRGLLDRVEGEEARRRLTAAFDHARSASGAAVADWYGFDRERVEERFPDTERGPEWAGVERFNLSGEAAERGARLTSVGAPPPTR